MDSLVAFLNNPWGQGLIAFLRISRAATWLLERRIGKLKTELRERRRARPGPMSAVTLRWLRGRPWRLN